MDARILTDNIQEETILAHAVEAGRLQGPGFDLASGLCGRLVARARGSGRGGMGARGCFICGPGDSPVGHRPLIMLCDPISERGQIAAIDAGVDLLLIRPVSMPVLMAYAKALVAAFGMVNRAALPRLRYESVQLNPANRTVTVNSTAPQRLSQLEYRLLHTLMAHQGQILPTETIVEHVWGYAGDGDRSLGAAAGQPPAHQDRTESQSAHLYPHGAPHRLPLWG